MIVVDLENEEIKDTYKIGQNGNYYGINSCAFDNNNIFVASEGGVYYADNNSSTLFDFNSWILDTNRTGNYENIFAIEDSIWVGNENSYYNNKSLILSTNDTIFKYNNLLLSTDTIVHNKLESINFIYEDNEENMWVADENNGLLKFTNSQFQERFVPEGPVRNDVYSLEYENNTLYINHGGHANFGTNSSIKDGVSIRNNSNDWINYDYYTLGNSRDILEVAIKNGKEYYASWYNGIAEMKDGELIKNYGYENTNGILDTTYYSNNRIRISDLKFDSEGNLWGLSSEVNHPLFVKTKNDEWFSFSMNQDRVKLFFDDLIIDQNNLKWGVIGRSGGLFVYDDNNTISNSGDDQYKILKNTVGQGNLPSMRVFSITEDLDGEIWVGTDKGIGIFYNPSAMFSGNNFDAQQVLITEG